MVSGLDRYQIKKIIMDNVNRNPDLKYYINNDYIYELVDAIIDGVSISIEENTRAMVEQIERGLR